jgi:hypothetical protein
MHANSVDDLLWLWLPAIFMAFVPIKSAALLAICKVVKANSALIRFLAANSPASGLETDM